MDGLRSALRFYALDVGSPSEVDGLSNKIVSTQLTG